MGNREQTIQQAIERLAEAGTVTAQSPFFYSEPWGFESVHPFCNNCVRLLTSLSPIQLLRFTQTIERSLGRTKKSQTTNDRLCPETTIYSDRLIDIDLIRAFDEKGEEIFISSPELTLPHPLWTVRDFVRIPLESIQE